MMGRREQGQGQFFYAFDLDKVVPPDRIWSGRSMACSILIGCTRSLRRTTSHTGRPSIDPMHDDPDADCGLRVCDPSGSGGCAPEVQVNLWPIGGFASSASRIGYPTIRCSAVPGTSAFAKSDALRRIFESVVAKCIAWLGWLAARIFDRCEPDQGGRWTRRSGRLAISKVDWPKAEEASRAVREYLTALDARQKPCGEQRR